VLQSGTNLDTQKWEKNDGGNCRARLPKEARLGWTQKLMIRIEQAEASLERRKRSSSKRRKEKAKSRYQKHE
jgi:hypothetical protein